MRAVFNFVTLLCIVILGCAATKNLNKEMSSLATDQKLEASIGSHASATSTTTAHWGLEADLGISISPEAHAPLLSAPSDSLTQIFITYGEGHISSEVIPPELLDMPEYPEPVSAVANKIVKNYLNSKNKEPGGHCLNVSKKRFEKAYWDIYGHTVYEDLPDSIATSYYTPREVFDFLYVSATGIHEGWCGLPMRAFGVPLEVAGLVEQIFERARARYGGDAWSPMVVRLLEDALGTELRAPGFPARLAGVDAERRRS
jgi:hypothetical protein